MRLRLRLLSLAILVTVPLIGPVHDAGAARPAVSASAGPIALTPSAPSDGTITLTPNLSSPQPVETPITWTATTSISTPLYQFAVGTASSGPFTVTRDFSPFNAFSWAQLDEGTYYVQVSVKSSYTGTVAGSTVVPYTLVSRVSGTQPVVSATSNHMMALFSAPACASGTMTVRFAQTKSRNWQSTNTQPCVAGLSRNFLVAGMYPKKTYKLVDVVTDGGTSVTSTVQTFTTGALPPLAFKRYFVALPPQAGADTNAHFIFHSGIPTVATDLGGNISWYLPENGVTIGSAVRIEPTGANYGSEIMLFANSGTQQGGSDTFRTLDLLGNPIQETNVQAINAQLAARGQEPIYGFHHDALLLPNGDTAVLAHTYQTITTTLVLGLMLVVLDPNFQVAWTWDAFQHLNPYRGPTLGERCANDPPHYCPPPGTKSTIDWLHGNAISWSPSDQNLTLSLRNQDWVIKINYANGTGNGDVRWRMGVGGDFSIVPLNGSDPYPWFSHQHDANYLDGTTMTLFDNGNTRCATAPPPCDSRGQTYIINEQTKVVTQTLNADLGAYSVAFGTAQRLGNGNFAFTNGLISQPPPPYAQDIEVLPNGTPAYIQQLNTTEYRSFRLTTLYAPTNPPCPTCQYNP